MVKFTYTTSSSFSNSSKTPHGNLKENAFWEELFCCILFVSIIFVSNRFARTFRVLKIDNFRYLMIVIIHNWVLNSTIFMNYLRKLDYQKCYMYFNCTFFQTKFKVYPQLDSFPLLSFWRRFFVNQKSNNLQVNSKKIQKLLTEGWK